MPEDTKFDDESFDISEIEGSVDTGPLFLHDGTRVVDSSEISVKNTILQIRSFFQTPISVSLKLNPSNLYTIFQGIFLCF